MQTIGAFGVTNTLRMVFILGPKQQNRFSVLLDRCRVENAEAIPGDRRFASGRLQDRLVHQALGVNLYRKLLRTGKQREESESEHQEEANFHRRLSNQR